MDSIMPYSYSKYKAEFGQHMRQTFHPEMTILDVGAGSGGYSNLLFTFFRNLDGVEIHEEYAKMFDLYKKYRNLKICNIFDYEYLSYEYVIMGDVIEHMTVSDAQKIINDIHNAGRKMMVAVPYQFKQEAEFNNQYEVHIQDDLTPALMLERYPCLQLVWGDSFYGYYTNYKVN